MVVYVLRIGVLSCFFFVKQKTAYEWRISDWSSDVCASDLGAGDVPDRLFIDSSCIKVHRCAGGAKGGPWLMVSAARREAATPSSMPSATSKVALASCS